MRTLNPPLNSAHIKDAFGYGKRFKRSMVETSRVRIDGSMAE